MLFLASGNQLTLAVDSLTHPWNKIKKDSDDFHVVSSILPIDNGGKEIRLYIISSEK